MIFYLFQEKYFKQITWVYECHIEGCISLVRVFMQICIVSSVSKEKYFKILNVR
jgi:hypothetical protein